MGKPDAAYSDLDEVIGKMWFKPHRVRVLAVKAELSERAKPSRKFSQKDIATMFGVSARMLRSWVARYLEEGVDGLRARGGQGRKREVSKEDVAAVIKDSLESGGIKAKYEKGDGDSACPACDAAEDPREKPEPETCGCKGKCKKPSKCKCKPGKTCRCKCCRPLKLPPMGPRHVPGCPRARIFPTNATTAAAVRDAIEKELGTRYSMSRVYALLSECGLSSQKLSAVQVNHASLATVTAWQSRQPKRVVKLRKVIDKICAFDECHIVIDKATGRVWVEKGKRAALPYAGPRLRISLFGFYFEDGTVRIYEYAHGDSRTFLDAIGRICAEFGKVAIYLDRAPQHRSKETKKGLRRLRRDPSKNVRLLYLPQGSPYLNVVEAVWNMLKAAVSRHYYYLKFDDFRRAISDFADNAVLDLDLHKFLSRDPRKYVFAT